MTCRAITLACRQEDESPYLPSEKAKSNPAAANHKVVCELERHTVVSACTETLTLMDVNVANILVANISGFTVYISTQSFFLNSVWLLRYTCRN